MEMYYTILINQETNLTARIMVFIDLFSTFKTNTTLPLMHPTTVDTIIQLSPTQ